MLETVSLLCDEAQQVGSREDRKIVRWYTTQASIHSSQGVVGDKSNEDDKLKRAPPPQP